MLTEENKEARDLETGGNVSFSLLDSSQQQEGGGGRATVTEAFITGPLLTLKHRTVTLSDSITWAWYVISLWHDITYTIHDASPQLSVTCDGCDGDTLHQSLVTSRYWQITQHFKGFFKIHTPKFLAQYCIVCRFTLVTLVSHKYSLPKQALWRGHGSCSGLTGTNRFRGAIKTQKQ